MTTQRYDVAIVGGGIVGLATAMELSIQYPRSRVVVVEKEREVAAHQSSHNSGVIHSGLYYRPGSQKAEFCVAGARALLAFCDRHAIKYDLAGKVIVATDEEELPALETLYERGTANGVEGLEMIASERLQEVEPHTRGVRGLLSPKTGIVDYKEVSRTYAAKAQEKGVEIITGAQVQKIARSGSSLHLVTTRSELEATYLVNCAGLYSDVVAQMAGATLDVRIIPVRGEYYELVPERHHLVKGLIYPVPNPMFPYLGVHFTRMIHGGVEAGPNAVLAFAREGYSKGDINISELVGTLAFPGFWTMLSRYWKTGVEELSRSFSKRAFAEALQKLVPEIREDDLVPAGSGVRAQAVNSRGDLLDDFSIVKTENAIHVLNAPSPAATASLAIGKHIVGLAGRAFRLGD